jgi:hypothetical protein
MVSPDSRDKLARRQAETPLIALCRFPRPALLHRLRKGELSSTGHRIYGYHYVKKTPSVPAALVRKALATEGRDQKSRR